MHWVRTSLVRLLHIAFLATLLLGAALFGAGDVLANPNHLERLLNSDTVYQQLLDEGARRALDLGDATTQSILPSITGAELRSTLSAAFPKTFLDSSVHSVIDANYTWLRGNTTSPHFSVEVAVGKQRFAANVSQVLIARLRSVPECSLAQLRMLRTSDPYSLTCRPPGINTEVEATQVEQQLIHNQNFLNEASITQDTLTVGQNHSPYYRRLAWLPRAFQTLRYAPYACALLATLLALAAVYTLPNRRRGVWKIARTLLIAGLILVSARVAGTIAYNELRSYLLHSGASSPLQRLALDIAHNTLAALARIEVVAGVAYAAVAGVIAIGLLITRFAKNKRRDSGSSDGESDPPTTTVTAPATTTNKKKRPVMDIFGKPAQLAVSSKNQTVPNNVTNITVAEPQKKTSALGRRGIIQ